MPFGNLKVAFSNPNLSLEFGLIVLLLKSLLVIRALFQKFYLPLHVQNGSGILLSLKKTNN